MTDVRASKNLTFDESNAKLTELMCGRTVDCILRKGLEIIFVFTDGMHVTIASDNKYTIHYKKHETRIYLKGVGMGTVQGNLR